jgi:hypothetical protein
VTPEQVLALFGPGAELLDPTDPNRCPACGAATEPSPAGHRTYCLRCTVAELPGTFADNSVRVEFAMTWNTYWNRVERYGTVWQNPHAWTTSREKIRKGRRS